MSIIKSSQRYKITNEENGLVFDMSRYKITDGENGMNIADGRLMNKSTVGEDFHGGDNQQWITEKHDDGQWTIRSVRYQEYIALDNTPENGTALFGLDKPQRWDIEILSESEDHDNPRVKYVLSRTSLAIIAPDVRFL
ncbi:hypothetical protein EI94DRAFT_461207 [Lactarius quietus]|nr:hypothetical protein EI94DRAFT_461207 [Lactarius quietus]